VVLGVILCSKLELFHHSLFLILLFLVSQILILFWGITSFPKGLDTARLVLRVFFIQNKMVWYGAVVLVAMKFHSDIFVLSAAGTLILLLLVALLLRCKKKLLIEMLSYLVVGSVVLSVL
jgi:hypothetical protein